MDSSLAQVTCETSQVLLAGSQVFFLGDLTFSPHLPIDSAQNEWNPQNQMLSEKTSKMLFFYQRSILTFLICKDFIIIIISIHYWAY